MALTALQVRKAKRQAKPYKLFDGAGLFLLVHPNGSKYWRLKYRFDGKHKTYALGIYPEISLSDARNRRGEARTKLAKGIDPSAERQAEKRAKAASDSFETIGREWIEQRRPLWSEGHAKRVIGRLERDTFPWIGSRRVDELEAPEILRMLRRIEGRGAIESAHRVKQYVGQIFRYAIATGRASRDPAADLKGALKPTKVRHLPSITDPREIGPLLRAIDGYQGDFITRCALQLAPLWFVRPGELRKAQWSEFDFDEGEWRIGAERMKMPAPHIVPLSSQARAILDELHPLTGGGQYVFPGARAEIRPMSENTINGALRRIGYAGTEMTGHGFRSMASTLLNEQGWNRDAIERQLAHSERDGVRAAYNYAEYLPERRQMMQAWADYLDSLKRGAEVVPIGAAG